MLPVNVLTGSEAGVIASGSGLKAWASVLSCLLLVKYQQGAKNVLWRDRIAVGAWLGVLTGLENAN